MAVGPLSSKISIHHKGEWYYMSTTTLTPLRPTTVVAETLRGRVQRGAELLDAERTGWAAAVGTRTLDMGDTVADVLGQLFGDYFVGLKALGLTTNHEAAAHGFSLLVD